MLLKIYIKQNWHFQRTTAKYYILFPGKFYQTILLSLSDVNLYSKSLLTEISANSTFRTMFDFSLQNSPQHSAIAKAFNSVWFQPSKFTSALGNCQGFCWRKSAFFLICVSKLLPKQNCPNIHLNFGINCCKK